MECRRGSRKMSSLFPFSLTASSFLRSIAVGTGRTMIESAPGSLGQHVELHAHFFFLFPGSFFFFPPVILCLPVGEANEQRQLQTTKRKLELLFFFPKRFFFFSSFSLHFLATVVTPRRDPTDRKRRRATYHLPFLPSFPCLPSSRRSQRTRRASEQPPSCLFFFLCDFFLFLPSPSALRWKS